MKAYISCPLTEPLEKIHQVSAFTQTKNIQSVWYPRGTTYSDTAFKSADIFILITPNNQFDMPFADLTAGCQKELALAQSLGKPLYLAYWKNKGNELQIYPIMTDKLPGRVLGRAKGAISQFAPQISNTYPIW